MQFRNFTWPNEPSSLRVTSRRRTALLEEPGGGWTLQDLGTRCCSSAYTSSGGATC